VPGASLLEVCREVEAEIVSRGGQLAFPAQTSRNEIAAHYCPGPGDGTVYERGDLAKLDVGVHVDGWVVDTAVTVSVGGEPSALVDAVQAALAAAIAAAGPEVPVSRLAAAIARTVRERGYAPVRNLCGHGVGRWRVHCPPPIPNLPDGTRGSLPARGVVAVEPFATEGRGVVVESGEPQVFQLRPRGGSAVPGDPAVVEAIRALRGLPFSRRQLGHLGSDRIERTLEELSRTKRLISYPPLVEPRGQRVAQAEHSIFVSEAGVEILT
jgi:methionyl aminopeptidase